MSELKKKAAALFRNPSLQNALELGEAFFPKRVHSDKSIEGHRLYTAYQEYKRQPENGFLFEVMMRAYSEYYKHEENKTLLPASMSVNYALSPSVRCAVRDIIIPVNLDFRVPFSDTLSLSSLAEVVQEELEEKNGCYMNVYSALSPNRFNILFQEMSGSLIRTLNEYSKELEILSTRGVITNVPEVEKDKIHHVTYIAYFPGSRYNNIVNSNVSTFINEIAKNLWDSIDGLKLSYPRTSLATYKWDGTFRCVVLLDSNVYSTREFDSLDVPDDILHFYARLELLLEQALSQSK